VAQSPRYIKDRDHWEYEASIGKVGKC
jgi:hypothetical protein